MTKTPHWLEVLENSPVGAEIAARGKEKESAAAFLEIYHTGLQRIRTAWEKGDIDDQYLFTVFPDIYDLLRYATTTDKTTRLIYRQRTAAEAFKEFPQPLNSDASRNFPIAVSADKQPKPLVFDLTTNSGPTLVIAEQYQLDDFLDTVSQSAILANHPNSLRICRKNTNIISSLADQVCQRSIPGKPKNIVIAFLSPQTPTDTLINLGWISRMSSPACHLILAIKPNEAATVIQYFKKANNKIDVWPDTPITITISAAPYFIKTDAANPQGKIYFPLAP